MTNPGVGLGQQSRVEIKVLGNKVIVMGSCLGWL